jgi:hypothetical protein
VNGKDIGKIERGDGAGFLLEAAQAVASCEKDSGSSFNATSRPRRASRARYTSPLPPAPSSD